VNRYSFFDKDTGALHGKTVVLNIPDSEIEAAVKLNAPPGHEPICGAYDADTQCVDIKTGAVIARATPAGAVTDARKRHLAMARIAMLEASQSRRVRELLAKDDPRLSAIDAEIQALRADLQALPSKPD
jgi:hypothetical protein